MSQQASQSGLTGALSPFCSCFNAGPQDVEISEGSVPGCLDVEPDKLTEHEHDFSFRRKEPSSGRLGES